MSHWWKYPLADVIPFSLEAYYRLVESYAAAVWPVQAITLLAAAVILALMLGAGTYRGQITLALLSLMWAWIAAVFFLSHYAVLFWAASGFAILFGIQAALLVALTAAKPAFAGNLFNSRRLQLGGLLFAFALIGYPTIATVATPAGFGSELIGMTPEATATATLALLAGMHGRLRWVAMIIPLIWCIIASVIFWTLGSAIALLPIICGVIAIGVGLLPASRSAIGSTVAVNPKDGAH